MVYGSGQCGVALAPPLASNASRSATLADGCSGLGTVFSSRYSGTLMLTRSPRRSRMFCVKVEKRRWWLITPSATNSEAATGPPVRPASVDGSRGVAYVTGSPMPSSGKLVKVTGTSPGSKAAVNSHRRSRMFASSCVTNFDGWPPKGRAGVASIINSPYSGRQAVVALASWAASAALNAGNSNRDRSDSFATFFPSPSKLRRTKWYSISSPN
mmetsp:Transcript_95/g.272  ORF Transcript_95/g.272 Transcript_95/m.272 type:complete len:213 (+) Transcript_95:999-1637(+)